MFEYKKFYYPPSDLVGILDYSHHVFPSTVDVKDFESIKKYIKHDVQKSLYNAQLFGNERSDLYTLRAFIGRDLKSASFHVGIDFKCSDDDIFKDIDVIDGILKEKVFRERSENIFRIDHYNYSSWIDITDQLELRMTMMIRFESVSNPWIISYQEQFEQDLKEALKLTPKISTKSSIEILNFTAEDPVIAEGDNNIDGNVVLDHLLYPFLPKDPQEIIDGFFKSKANILFLAGCPGSGKSSFIRAMGRDKMIKLISENESLSSKHLPKLQNNLYATSSKDDVIYVFEDVEGTLEKRTSTDEGSSFTKLLLQITSGVGKINTKIVITGNNITPGVIDKALLRSERCFGFYEFRKLTYEEAIKAAEILDVEPPKDKQSISLCDLINGVNQYSKVSKFGFV